MDKRTHTDDVLIRTLADIREDYSELRFLHDDVSGKIASFQTDLYRIWNEIPSETVKMTQRLSDRIRESLDAQDGMLESMKTLPRNPQPKAIQDLLDRKYELYSNLRVIERMVGAIISSLDWQSPAYSGSRIAQSGRDSGRISVAVNDYKRDQHYMAISYESAFRKEYLGGAIRLPYTVLATHSGMSAFSTILGFLLTERHVSGPVIAGRSVYFEAFDLLKKHFGTRLIVWDEADPRELVQILKHTKPQAIFLDSLGNTPTMIMADMRGIKDILREYILNTCYLVIDNTCMATVYNPLKDFGNPLSRIRPIVYESLNKFHQFGLDRTLGGVIWAAGRDGGHLFDFREHLGTVIEDAQVSAIPMPNRKRLDTRLKRLERNAHMLAEDLAQRAGRRKTSPVSAVIFPRLPGHPSFTYAGKLGFGGAFFIIDLKERFRKSGTLKRIAANVIREARKRNVRMAAGTSFGLPVTRIYPTATRSETTKPFLRISPGTETLMEIPILGDVLSYSLGL